MGVRIGTSGWSYPSWRPGFYPEGTAPSAFLGFYAERFETVELNTTGYRLPAAEQFARWAEAVPEGFRFAPKLALGRPSRLDAFFAHVGALGDRLGPVRVVVEGARDDALLDHVRAAAGPEVELAFDLRETSWAGVAGIVRVNDLDASPFRYIRLREPPYSSRDLRLLAGRLRGPAYVYFGHEDEPTAPAYAARLRELLG